jgi:hypothetical protein
LGQAELGLAIFTIYVRIGPGQAFAYLGLVQARFTGPTVGPGRFGLDFSASGFFGPSSKPSPTRVFPRCSPTPPPMSS